MLPFLLSRLTHVRPGLTTATHTKNRFHCYAHLIVNPIKPGGGGGGAQCSPQSNWHEILGVFQNLKKI